MRVDHKRKCRVCDRYAACYGQYEGDAGVEFSCDVHCGHGNEDGRRRPMEDFDPRCMLRLVGDDG